MFKKCLQQLDEYLLEKWHRTCAYCGAKDVPLQVDHVVPRSEGGSNRVSNLTLACSPCNQKKGSQPIALFLKKQPELAKKIQAQAKAPLKDAAAVNASRWALVNRLKAEMPVTTGSGGRTKFNRTRQHYTKDHWIDAACVGQSGEQVLIRDGMKPLTITSKGRGSHQVVRTDKFGFPRGKAGRMKRVHGFSTGDIVKLVMTKGKYAGIYVARLAGIRATGTLDIKTVAGTVGASHQHFQLVQRNDGFDYSTAA